jgi:CheY-like chemotaxis protein
MRILVIEDSPKHLEDARRYAQQLAGCTVDFATTLAEAIDLLTANNYDGAISDVFFPTETGASADTYESAITINDRLLKLRIHHVFNTAGNHHGDKFQGFIWQTPVPMYGEHNGHFLTTGMMIEAYPSNRNAEKNTKQWQAAFRYILLVLSFVPLPDKGREIIEQHNLGGFPYGDYGQLTQRFERCDHPFVVDVFRRYNA